MMKIKRRKRAKGFGRADQSSAPQPPKKDDRANLESALNLLLIDVEKSLERGDRESAIELLKIYFGHKEKLKDD